MAAGLTHTMSAETNLKKQEKKLNNMYGLIKAERQQQLVKPGIKPVDALEKPIYGKVIKLSVVFQMWWVRYLVNTSLLHYRNLMQL